MAANTPRIDSIDSSITTLDAKTQPATPTTAGVVKADRFYQQSLTSDVYGGTVATFNNLIIGKDYLVGLSARCRADSGAGVAYYALMHDSSELVRGDIYLYTTGIDLHASLTRLFTATTTTATIVFNQGTAGGSRSRGASYCWFREMNSAEVGAF